MRPKLVDEHATGAVHGLDCAILAVDLGGIHVVLIVLPMPRIFPKGAGENYGSLNFDITLLAVKVAPIVGEDIFEHHAVGQEEREALALVQKGKQLEFLAEFYVVALFGLFKHVEVGLHFVLLCKGNAVDAGEHLVLFVSAPICAGD